MDVVFPSIWVNDEFTNLIGHFWRIPPRKTTLFGRVHGGCSFWCKLQDISKYGSSGLLRTTPPACGEPYFRWLMDATVQLAKILRACMPNIIHWKIPTPIGWTHLKTSGGCCACPPPAVWKCSTKANKGSEWQTKKHTVQFKSKSWNLSHLSKQFGKFTVCLEIKILNKLGNNDINPSPETFSPNLPCHVPIHQTSSKLPWTYHP